jgi:hypothetical protein
VERLCFCGGGLMENDDIVKLEHNKKHLVYRDGVRMFDIHCPACVANNSQQESESTKRARKMLARRFTKNPIVKGG